VTMASDGPLGMERDRAFWIRVSWSTGNANPATLGPLWYQLPAMRTAYDVILRPGVLYSPEIARALRRWAL